MRITPILAIAVLLAGCSSTTKLGTMLYVPHGQHATLTVGPPPATTPASAPR